MPKQKRKNKQKQAVVKPGFLEKHLSRRARIILLACVAVIVVAAIGVGVWSINYTKSKPYREVAISINGTNSIKNISMRYYVNALKILYGAAPANTSISQFADFGEQQIEQAQTIIMGSQALGVQVKRSDVTAEIKKSGKPVSQERVDLTTATDLVDKQVPANQPQYRLQAMLLESEAAVQEAKNRLQAGESFDNVTAELSKLPATGTVHSDLEWKTARQVDMEYSSTSLGDAVAGAAVGAVTGPSYDASVNKEFGYWVVEAVEKKAATDNTTSDQLHIQGLLLGSEQDAQDALAKLNGGADINELAKQISQQIGAQDNGADIGWITKNDITSPFSSLFDLPLNTIAGPIEFNQAQTKGGYWLFTVLEKNASMALTSDQENTLSQDLIAKCAAALSKDPNYRVENLLTQKMKDFALNQVVLAQGQGSVLISDAELPIGEQGLAYSQQLVAYGSTSGNTWSITDGTLPQGLSLDPANGVISGTPVYAGAAGFTIKVSNAFHYWTQDMVITIHISITVTTSSLPDGQVGTAYSATLDAMTDSSIYNWAITAGSLPDGLSLDSASGGINGTPKTAGSYSFTVQVDDGLKKDTKDLSINIK